MSPLIIVWVLFWGHNVSYFESQEECLKVEEQVVQQGYAIVKCHREVLKP